ncbi:MAG TPA: hypothetical protein VGH58_09910 [Solirubrobacterales bacterium]|jgi:hypothetical protein
MKSASAPLLAWGCLQLLLGAGLAAFSEGAPALLFLAAAAPVLCLAAWNRVRPASEDPRLLPSLSVPVVVLALGVALAALGLTAGLWLCLVGGEIALFGAVWLGRELKEERRWGR